jgi:phosphoribosylformylglycinamidine synthase subunit PurL
VQDFTQKAIRKGLINAAQDISDGGLFVALAEMAFANEIGFSVSMNEEMRADAFLFGEAQGRILLSVSENNAEALKALAKTCGVPLEKIGITGGEVMQFGKAVSLSVSEAKKIYMESLGNRLNR